MSSPAFLHALGISVRCVHDVAACIHRSAPSLRLAPGMPALSCWSYSPSADGFATGNACMCVCAGVPYDLTPDFLTELFTKHRIDYVVHGDDPCILPDGTDAYAHAKKHGRFRMVSLLGDAMHDPGQRS